MKGITKNQKILGAVAGLIIIIALAAAYFRGDFGLRSKSGEETASTTINIGDLNLDVTGQDGVTVKIEPIGNLPPAPKLPREIAYPENYTPEVRSIMDKKIEGLVSLLKKNPRNIEAWLDLGIVYKQVGDYQGAKEAWEYVSVLSPGNIVSFNNLGDLYHYYLKDYPNAEKSFLQAIKNDSKYVLSYINLHDLYRYSYKSDTAKAADILKQGISANPGNIDFLVTLAAYYKEKGDTKNARLYYEEALIKAKSVANQSLIDAINAELKALK